MDDWSFTKTAYFNLLENINYCLYQHDCYITIIIIMIIIIAIIIKTTTSMTINDNDDSSDEKG